MQLFSFITLAVLALVAVAGSPVSAQTGDTQQPTASVPTTPSAVVAPLPKKLSFWLYPDNRGGRRGHEVWIERFVQDGQQVTAAVTMHGRAQNKCIVHKAPATGTLIGDELMLVVGASQDGRTCPMRFELKLGPNGVDGKFYNEPYRGDAKS